MSHVTQPGQRTEDDRQLMETVEARSASIKSCQSVRRTLHLRAIQSTMDRMIHNLTPILASVVLIGGGVALITGEPGAPFAIAGSTTLFLLSGIYRTWGQTLALIELSDQG